MLDHPPPNKAMKLVGFAWLSKKNACVVGRTGLLLLARTAAGAGAGAGRWARAAVRSLSESYEYILRHPSEDLFQLGCRRGEVHPS